MKHDVKTVAGALLAAAFVFLAPPALAKDSSQSVHKPSTLGIGVFSFMSGPGAAYGEPGVHGAKTIIKQINDGGGVDGVPIKAHYVDEAQGKEGVISSFRRLSGKKSNQVMIAALSSSNCLALAPVADELHEPMIPWNCDTYQLFEKHHPYVYRANSTVIPEFMAYVIYFAQQHPDAKRIAIVGPDYALGHDASKIIKAALKRFLPDAKVVVDLLPKLGSSNYTTDITRIAAARPDAVFVNLWGGDLETFVQQALSRHLFQSTQMVIAMGSTVLQKFGKDFPAGVIVGFFGAGYWNSPTAQSRDRTKKFIAAYRKQYGQYPTFPAFKMANAILTMQAGYDKAIKASDDSWASEKQLTEALAGIQVKTLTGTLHIRKADHDGVRDQIVGITEKSDKYPFKVVKHMVRYPGAKVTPPADTDPFKWIAQLPHDFVSQLPKPGSYK